MRRAFLLPLLALLAAAPVRADGEDDDPAAQRRQVQELRQQLLAANRVSGSSGDVQIQMSVIPDYFVYLALQEYLEADLQASSLEFGRERMRRLREEHDDAVGVPALVLRFEHAHARDRDFYAFQGSLAEHVKAKAKFKLRFAGGEQSAGLVTQEMTLFNASRSRAFGRGNVPPVIKRVLNRFGGDPVTLTLILREPFDERAEEVQVLVGGLIHFHGGGIRGDQADFTKGARADEAEPARLELQLPLSSTPVPAALARLLEVESEEEE